MKAVQIFLLVLSLSSYLSLYAQRRGDVNVDGYIDNNDIISIIDAIAGSQFHHSLADVNADKSIDVSDVVLTINIINKKNENIYPYDDINDIAVLEGLCPDSHHPHAIDLGIGFKWSCCNLDASAPWEHGGYYAYGEIEQKDKYSLETYKFFDYDSYMKGYSLYDCYHVPGNLVTFNWDAARYKWSNELQYYNNWTIPSKQDFKLLIDKCTSVWTTINGVVGRKYIGKNGNAIFFPAAGYHLLAIIDSNKYGEYWTSTYNDKSRGYCFHFDNIRPNLDSAFGERGCSIRPVMYIE